MLCSRPKAVNSGSLLLLALLLLPCALPATPPLPPQNIRSILMPAEILLSWDAPAGAAYYRVTHSDASRRWIPMGYTTEPRVRDKGFPALPCLYQIVAYNEAGEFSASAEFTVSDQAPAPDWYGVNVRPVSDTAVAVSWNMPLPGDALLELGTAPGIYERIFSQSAFSNRQEFVLNDLLPLTTYSYRLTSATAAGA